MAKQSKGQKVWSAIKTNTLEDFIDKDKLQESIRQKEAKKYLGENCYHRIEYSVANSLAALMWRWYLNSDKQPYIYSQRFQEGADGTMIKINNFTYTWKVEMKEIGEYKRERCPLEGGPCKNKEKKHCSNKNRNFN